MPDVGLDTTWPGESVCEVPLGAGVLRLVRPGVAVRGPIDRRGVVNWVEVTCSVISAMRELFSEVEGVEFWPWIVQATELPPWKESLSPAGMEMRLLAGGR